MQEHSASEPENKVELERRARAVGAIAQRFGWGALEQIGVKLGPGMESSPRGTPGRRHIILGIEPRSGVQEVWRDPSIETRDLVARVREAVSDKCYPVPEAEAYLDERHSLEIAVAELEAGGATVLVLGEFYVIFRGKADPPNVCGAPFLRLRSAVDAVFRGKPLPIGFEAPNEYEQEARRTWAVRTIYVFWLATDKDSTWSGGSFSGELDMARSSAVWTLFPSRQQELCEIVEKALEILAPFRLRVEENEGVSVEQPDKGEPPSPAVTIARLPPAARKAILQYLAVEEDWDGEKRPTDQEAHEKAVERFGQKEVGALKNWSRHLRTARRASGLGKYTRRDAHGSPSVPREHQVSGDAEEDANP